MDRPMDRHRGDRVGGGGGDGGRRMPSRWSSGSPNNNHRYPRGGGGQDGFAGGRHHPYSRPQDYPPGEGAGGPGIRSAVGGGGGGGGPGEFGHQMPMHGQKRGFPGRGNSPDYADGNKFAKLFIGSVPKTATEGEIRPLFEEHGNVIEVALIKDRRTGEQQGCCFIKYATSEEADRAIRALHNQYTLPGGSGPIQVRYADGERERAGTVEDKLFVASLNKRATEQEIAEIFSAYGHVVDVYLMRDELKQSRGCGFVKFSNREMAAAAMNGLHGSFVMRGCEQPLIVRFADPKRPRPGDQRGGPAFGGPGFGHRSDGFGPRSEGFGPRSEGFGPRSDASVVIRPTSNLDEPMGGRMPPNAWGPISPPSMGPSSQAGTHGFGSHPSAKVGGMETPSAAASNLGDAAGPTSGSLSSLAAVPSSLTQQVHPVMNQQIMPLQKPLMTPQLFPPSLQPHHNQQISASSSQTQILQASMQQPGQLQIPQSIGLPSNQPVPSQQFSGLSGQLSASQSHVQQNTAATALQTPLGLQQQGMSAISNPQQLLQRPVQQVPSQLVLQQQAQALQSSFQSSQQAILQLQQQLQGIQNSQTAKQQSPWSGPQTTSSTPASAPAMVMPSTVSATPSQPTSTTSSVPLTCNWTEHTSPEGFKYYYNSVTQESKWEKPEEFSIFEQQQQQQKLLLLQQQQLQQQLQQQQQQQQQKLVVPQLQSPANNQSHPQIQPNQQISQPPQMQPQMQLRQQPQLQLLQPSLAPQYHTSTAASHQNTQDFNYAQIQAVGTVTDPGRVQQGVQASQEWTWQNKPAGS